MTAALKREAAAAAGLELVVHNSSHAQGFIEDFFHPRVARSYQKLRNNAQRAFLEQKGLVEEEITEARRLALEKEQQKQQAQAPPQLSTAPPSAAAAAPWARSPRLSCVIWKPGLGQNLLKTIGYALVAGRSKMTPN